MKNADKKYTAKEWKKVVAQWKREYDAALQNKTT